MISTGLLILALVSPAHAVEPRTSDVWLDAAAFQERAAGLEIRALPELPMDFTVVQRPFSLADDSVMRQVTGRKLGILRGKLVRLKGVLAAALRALLLRD
jgi:hypothetical protein